MMKKCLVSALPGGCRPPDPLPCWGLSPADPQSEPICGLCGVCEEVRISLNKVVTSDTWYERGKIIKILMHERGKGLKSKELRGSVLHLILLDSKGE